MANKIYHPHESAITWLSTGGTNVITPTSLGAAAGRQGAYYDRGAGAVARTYAYRAWLKPGGTRVVGEYVEIGLVTSNGSRPDNDDGTGDIAISSVDKLRNLRRLRPIVIDENAAVEMVSSGLVFIEARWFAPWMWNRTANTLSATATDYGFEFIPIPDEIQ